MPPPEVIVDLLSDDERELLAACGEAMNESASKVWVKPLGRFGYTSVRLYAAHFSDDGGGFPFVVKVGPTAAIAREMASIDSVKSYYEDALSGRMVKGAAGRDAIIYPMISEKPGDSAILELTDLVYKDVDDPAKTAEVDGLLASVYTDCCAVAHKTVKQKMRLLDEYESPSSRDYLRERAATEKFALHFGDTLDPGPREFHGATVLDPRATLASLEAVELEGHSGVLHGDLHCNNIVIGHARQPHLIDFAWGHQHGHVFKDYVLMECSLRFLLFPYHVELQRQLAVDELLLQEDGPQRIDEALVGEGLDNHYRQMACLVGTIRAAARDACAGSYDFNEYLLSQFIVLYGLLAYKDYNFLVATRALGLIGRQLEGRF